MTTPKLHPAAVRAAAELEPEPPYHNSKQVIAEAISAAIDDHLKSIGYERDMGELKRRRIELPAEIRMGIDDHLKSAGWEDLRRTAELLLAHLYEFETAEFCGEDLDALDHILRRVRGEK